MLQIDASKARKTVKYERIRKELAREVDNSLVFIDGKCTSYHNLSKNKVTYSK